MLEQRSTTGRPLAIIMQGGAMRAAFGAGVLYEFAERGVFPDVIASASAGVPTAAYYVARQHEDMRTIWTKGVGKDFINITNLFFGKPVFDIRYLLNEVMRKRHPLSVETIAHGRTRLVIPLYNCNERKTELRTSTDSDFLENVWLLLHVSLIVHADHILHGTPFEKYVDGALDPFALFKENFLPENARVVVIWNEPRFDMHFVKYLGHKMFMWLQAHGAPEGALDMLKTRDQLIQDGLRVYKKFCEQKNPTVIIPESLSLVEGLDVLSDNSTHLSRLFEHGREKARVVLAAEAIERL